jgi:TetR/AcrR family transcriptional repressor of nem operon
MYHHFRGKSALALEALERSATEMRAQAHEVLSQGHGATERITAYLLRERDVLKGCPIGRLTYDPEIVVDATLRRPLAETFEWLQDTLTQILRQGVASGEFLDSMSPRHVAVALAAVLQGGYVLARAAQSVEPFDEAIAGALELLAAQRQPAAD